MQSTDEIANRVKGIQNRLIWYLMFCSILNLYAYDMTSDMINFRVWWTHMWKPFWVHSSQSVITMFCSFNYPSNITNSP